MDYSVLCLLNQLLLLAGLCSWLGFEIIFIMNLSTQADTPDAPTSGGDAA